MKIIIATTMVPFVRGGAEVHAEGLRHALIAAGHEAEIVTIPFKWYPPERMLEQMLLCRLLDLTECSGDRVDLLIGLKFPAYYIPHPRKALWILHQHRAAYDMWGHDYGDLHKFPNGRQIREAIERADRTLLPEAQTIFANSRNVAQRLKKYCGIDSEALYHPPPSAELYYSAEAEDYFFFPSRLTVVKRQELVLKALCHTRQPVQVRFMGIADEQTYTEELHALCQKLGVQSKVQWLGNLSEAEKIKQYAKSLGVIYPPLDEDYGYVSLEAMLASKPLITCTDSGGPLEFVASGEIGIAAEPTPESLGAALDQLWQNRAKAHQMGKAGRDLYAGLGISWKNVARRLLSSP
ncbi:MAG: glycosyltransferase family 4 protein [Acidobacteria bacterium]|nr:glycosyltransferase family 4 protein [Acidobacteriota bacterium]MBI3655445.1 glycosyltransferase family 4 protein [Acidobacteriota bacterium]